MEILENSRNRRWMDGRTYLRKDLDSQNVLNARSEYSFYRKFIPLKNQKRVMLRFLNEGDRQDLISLFQTAPNEDLRFCKHDLKDLKLLNHWLDHLNSPRLLPLVAVSLEINQLIAAATLLWGKHTAHHIPQPGSGFKNVGRADAAGSPRKTTVDEG
jgi:hypothetical protein